ncbi:MAG: hypothetical protein CL836_06510 [Crocinitomicaceae bacterium]|jgi:hypothetical protein|nr:hypothetical protein [Crocinitomicaceae bacterium]MBT03661.1 hypothetical protein [Crocinitomicaceae bacterium]|tara:strand:+ start:229 stop:549 length:321 start_codon:yes stop_codon:yes gene_type:complete
MNSINHFPSIFNVNYIVFEKNDTAFLLQGYVYSNQKKYYTTIPVEILRLSRLIEHSLGGQIMQRIWDRLYSSTDPIVEVNPKKHLNMDIRLKSSELGILTNKLKTA